MTSLHWICIEPGHWVLSDPKSVLWARIEPIPHGYKRIALRAGWNGGC